MARLACLFLAAGAVLAGPPQLEEHDITAAGRPIAWGE
jgi:hypothetical protein